MTRKQAIKRAEQIDNMLKNLQNKVDNLLDQMANEYMDVYPHLHELMNTLEDLKSFDLEDSIVNAKDYEY